MLIHKTSIEEVMPGQPQKFWLILAVSFIMLPHATHLPTWGFLSSIILIALALLLTLKNWRAMPKVLLWVLGALSFFATFLYFGNLNGRDPGVTLLSLMIALKLHEMHTQRDAYITIFLGYFLIITQFLFAQEMILILYLLAATLFLTMALVGLSDPLNSAPFKKRLQLSGRMLILSVPIMLLLFILFPRISGPLWGLPQDQNRAKTGLSDEMSPGQYADLIRSDELAFRVTFENTVPPEQQRYWRGPVLWDFDGWKWTRGYSPPFLMPKRDILTIGEPLRYRLMIEPTQKNWIMALDVTTGTPEDIAVSGDLQVYAKDSIQEYQEFPLQAHTEYRIGLKIGPLEKKMGLRLPDDYGPRARALAQRWKREHQQPEAILNAALLYFRNQPFVYTLSPGKLTEDPVDQFLFETRRGFCEHYSGSFVFLMRAAGIPARIVTGYLGGEYNTQAEYMTVRQSDAHAWAEVWLENKGWIRVDPTAAVSPERIEEGISASLAGSEDLPLLLRNRYGDSLINQFRLLLDSADFYWNYWVVSFGPERQKELFSRIGLEDIDWRELILLLISSIFSIVLIYLLFFIMKNRRKNRDPLQQAYLDFKKKLINAGIASPESEGPQELLSRLKDINPALASDTTPILEAYISARYQNRTTSEDVYIIKQMVRKLRINKT